MAQATSRLSIVPRGENRSPTALTGMVNAVPFRSVCEHHFDDAGMPPFESKETYVAWTEDGRRMLVKWSAERGLWGWIGMMWEGESTFPRVYRLTVGVDAPPVALTHISRNSLWV